jgi:hypothetical protein
MARGHGASGDTTKAGVVVMKVLLGVVVVGLTVRRLEGRDVVGGNDCWSFGGLAKMLLVAGDMTELGVASAEPGALSWKSFVPSRE